MYGSFIIKIKLFVMVVFVISSFVSSGCTYFIDQQYHHLNTSTPLGENQVLILGFLGGRQRWDDERRGTRKLALKLDGMNIPGVEIETFQNRRRSLAMAFIQNALDQNEDGVLDSFERSNARIIIFGQSLGGSAVVKLSRDLQRFDIPVLLTVQVDSVGFSDHLIPSNVLRAANLFQRNDLFFRGEDEIHPENPEATRIIANTKFDYHDKDVDLSGLPLHIRLFSTGHNKMDADPEVWATVEKMILAEISNNMDLSYVGEKYTPYARFQKR